MKTLRIALTGANGFIGAELDSQLRALGHTVVPLTRIAPVGAIESMRYSLGDSPDLSDFDTLIHCAHDFRKASANVEGSLRLFEAAHDSGVRNSLFFSSLSAFEGCRSQYGRGKLAVEKGVSQLGGVSVRLGFVYDKTERGLSGSLRKLARTLPIIPLPGLGRQRMHLFPAEELGISVQRTLESAKAGTVITLARKDAPTIASLLRKFAKEAGKSVMLVPFPWQLMWLGLRAIETTGASLNFRSDSLLSLVNQNPDPEIDELRLESVTESGEAR